MKVCKWKSSESFETSRSRLNKSWITKSLKVLKKFFSSLTKNCDGEAKSNFAICETLTLIWLSASTKFREWKESSGFRQSLWVEKFKNSSNSTKFSILQQSLVSGSLNLSKYFQIWIRSFSSSTKSATNKSWTFQTFRIWRKFVTKKVQNYFELTTNCSVLREEVFSSPKSLCWRSLKYFQFTKFSESNSCESL